MSDLSHHALRCCVRPFGLCIHVHLKFGRGRAHMRMQEYFACTYINKIKGSNHSPRCAWEVFPDVGTFCACSTTAKDPSRACGLGFSGNPCEILSARDVQSTNSNSGRPMPAFQHDVLSCSSLTASVF